MKRTNYVPLKVLLLLATVMLLIVACERPLQPELDEETVVQPAPQTDPIISQPDPIAPAPETLPEGGEQSPVEGQTPADSPQDEEEQPAETQPPDGETVAPGTEVTYIVQAGDTLGIIAQRYNVTVEAIASANQITNIHRLDIGQILIIPVGGPPEQTSSEEIVHIVQAGQNLFRIALQYGFTVEELVAYNNIANPHRIEVGQQILIPPGN